jgi:predicted Ser/Thr protein kinase
MDYALLNETSFAELTRMAQDMDIKPRRKKKDLIRDITEAFQQYEKYKKDKVDKYRRVKQLGNKGKEGITFLVEDKKGYNFAMKTFRKSKSSKYLRLEYTLQKKAASVGVSPRVVEYDSVSKYIVMEKMDSHLYDYMVKNKNLLRNQQLRILDIFEKLDNVGVFHGDSNILNYMIKNKEIYLIDYGTAREVTSQLINKLGTSTPNIKYMTLGLILKLREFNFPSSSWKYLKKRVSQEDKIKFKIE